MSDAAKTQKNEHLAKALWWATEATEYDPEWRLHNIKLCLRKAGIA